MMWQRTLTGEEMEELQRTAMTAEGFAAGSAVLERFYGTEQHPDRAGDGAERWRRGRHPLWVDDRSLVLRSSSALPIRAIPAPG
jgi:hypothetical protein